jgi:hypothetical protein
MNKIIIKGMKVGGFDVAVPHGLSEILNKANAWSIKTEKPSLEGYHREVVKKEDGKLMTIFTKIKEE